MNNRTSSAPRWLTISLLIAIGSVALALTAFGIWKQHASDSEEENPNEEGTTGMVVAWPKICYQDPMSGHGFGWPEDSSDDRIFFSANGGMPNEPLEPSDQRKCDYTAVDNRTGISFGLSFDISRFRSETGCEAAVSAYRESMEVVKESEGPLDLSSWLPAETRWSLTDDATFRIAYGISKPEAGEELPATISLLACDEGTILQVDLTGNGEELFSALDRDEMFEWLLGLMVDKQAEITSWESVPTN